MQQGFIDTIGFISSGVQSGYSYTIGFPPGVKPKYTVSSSFSLIVQGILISQLYFSRCAAPVYLTLYFINIHARLHPL